MGSLLKRLIKPKTIVGKVTGAVGSLLGIGGGGALAGFDLELVALVAISMAGGYAFGWSKDQVQDFISFLRGLPKKESK